MPPGKSGGPGSNGTILPIGMNLQSIWGLSCEDTGTPDGPWVLNICICRGCLIFLKMNWHFGQEEGFSQHQSHTSLSSDSLWISLEGVPPASPTSMLWRFQAKRVWEGTVSWMCFDPKLMRPFCVVILSFVKTPRVHRRVMRVWTHSEPTEARTERTPERVLLLRLVNWDLDLDWHHCF